jgi:4-hydroxy-tetrahydrodipicolinate reductase
MRVGQVGFGRAGRPVASVLLESKTAQLQWVLRRSRTLQHRSVPEFLGIPSDEPGLIYPVGEQSAAELLDREPVEVIVDFSSEDGIFDDTLEYVRSLGQHTRVLCSPNITLGVNFLIIAARILKNIAPDSDVEIVEQHFKNKREVSGTAKKIASTLDLPEESIKTVRAGGIIGVHEILFGFRYQTVRLKHESISREAFGTGILFAAERLEERPYGFYTMEDLLIPYFRLDASEAELAEERRRPWWKVWWGRRAVTRSGGNGQRRVV